jgi:hypothetical protein
MRVLRTALVVNSLVVSAAPAFCGPPFFAGAPDYAHDVGARRGAR